MRRALGALIPYKQYAAHTTSIPEDDLLASEDVSEHLLSRPVTPDVA